LIVYYFQSHSITLAIWWRPVYNGGRGNPDTMYLGRDHQSPTSTLANFLTLSGTRSLSMRLDDPWQTGSDRSTLILPDRLEVREARGSSHALSYKGCLARESEEETKR
jgi:hypothetical protein